MGKQLRMPETNTARLILMLSRLPIEEDIDASKFHRALEEVIKWDINEGNGIFRDCTMREVYNYIGNLNAEGAVGGTTSGRVYFMKERLGIFAQREVDEGQFKDSGYVIMLGDKLKSILGYDGEING